MSTPSHALMLTAEQATMWREWQERAFRHIPGRPLVLTLTRRQRENLSAATPLPMPTAWADIEPASPLPWTARGNSNGRPCVGYGAGFIVIGGTRPASAKDVRYAAVSANDRPVMLAQLAAQAADIELLRRALRTVAVMALSEGYTEIQDHIAEQHPELYREATT